MVGSDITTIIYVLGVNKSMNTAKFEFLTSMNVNCDANLLKSTDINVNNATMSVYLKPYINQ